MQWNFFAHISPRYLCVCVFMFSWRFFFPQVDLIFFSLDAHVFALVSCCLEKLLRWMNKYQGFRYDQRAISSVLFSSISLFRICEAHYTHSHPKPSDLSTFALKIHFIKENIIIKIITKSHSFAHLFSH